MNLRTTLRAALCALLPLTVHGCSALPPLETVDYVDISRFMGRWYVVAAIPTFLERDAYNAIESYRLATDGTIETTFTFNRGSFDGPVKTYEPRGYIEVESNAVWGMQFVWPFKADYRVIYLDYDYSATIVGRQKRDYVWIMSREPMLTDTALVPLIERVAAAGYDVADVVRIPHKAIATSSKANELEEELFAVRDAR